MTAVRPTRRARRRRGELDRDVILEAARTLAAAHAAITFRALGSELGADPTAVYRHFRDKDELVAALFDRFLMDTLDQVDADADWRSQLVEIATLSWNLCIEHPTVGVDAAHITTGGPGEVRAIETLLRQFRRAGLDQPEAVRFYALYSSYVLSVAGSVAGSRLRAGRSGAGVESSWLGELGPVDPQRHPTVAASRDELAALQDHDVYMTGLEVILDAAAAAGRREA